LGAAARTGEALAPRGSSSATPRAKAERVRRVVRNNLTEIPPE
jgi:hypothetical protein